MWGPYLKRGRCKAARIQAGTLARAWMSEPFIELEMGIKVPLERVLTYDQIAPRGSPSLASVTVAQQCPNRAGE